MSIAILLVEDEPALRELFAAALIQSGYAVVAAEDARKALSLEPEIDAESLVLITDVLLPGMNGHNLAKEVVLRRPTARVGFVTGWVEEELMKLGMCPNCCCILRKPFTLRDLDEFVKAIAGQSVCEGITDAQ